MEMVRIPSRNAEGGIFSKNRAVPALAAVVFVLASALVYLNRSSVSEQWVMSKMTLRSCQHDTLTDPEPDLENLHSDAPEFNVDPPSGGIHLPTPAPPGDYSTGEVPPDGQIVHANEHGYVAIWYRPSLSKSDLDRLRLLHEKYPADTLLVPRSTMAAAFAATAWNQRLLCDELETNSLALFINKYRNKGPERVPH